MRTVKKVKCTLVQALRLCTSRTAHRGSRGIALLFHDHDTRRGWGVSVTHRLLFTPRKDPATIVQKAEWAPGPVWTGAENLVPTGIRSPDRPARSQSLYRLSYPAFYEKCAAYKTGFFFSTTALHSVWALMLKMRSQIHTGLHTKWYCCIIFITTKQLHKFLYISQKPCFEDIHSKVLELLHANKWTDKQTYERMDGKSFNLCSTGM